MEKYKEKKIVFVVYYSWNSAAKCKKLQLLKAETIGMFFIF